MRSGRPLTKTRPLPPRLAPRPLTLPEQISESITAAILSGAYRPGDRILELDLAARFQVSRGPIREALRILDKDGVVRILPQRGAHVTALSAKEVNDIFEIRRELFCAVVRRYAKCDAAFLARIEADVRELEALAGRENSQAAYVEISARLSATLRDGCGNERLAEILATLARQTRRYTQLGLASTARRKESARNWRAMLRALKTGNLDAAVAAIRKLIDDSRREAVRLLEAEEVRAASRTERNAARVQRAGPSLAP